MTEPGWAALVAATSVSSLSHMAESSALFTRWEDDFLTPRRMAAVMLKILVLETVTLSPYL